MVERSEMMVTIQLPTILFRLPCTHGIIGVVFLKGASGHQVLQAKFYTATKQSHIYICTVRFSLAMQVSGQCGEHVFPASTTEPLMCIPTSSRMETHILVFTSSEKSFESTHEDYHYSAL